MIAQIKGVKCIRTPGIMVKSLMLWCIVSSDEKTCAVVPMIIIHKNIMMHWGVKYELRRWGSKEDKNRQKGNQEKTPAGDHESMCSCLSICQVELVFSGNKTDVDKRQGKKVRKQKKEAFSQKSLYAMLSRVPSGIHS